MSHESGCLIITDSSSSVSLLSWALPQARPPLVLTSPCEVDRAEAGQVRPARLERRRAEESSWIRVWVSVCQLPAWVSTLHPTGGLGTCSRAFYSPEPLPLNWFPFPFFMVKEELNDQFSYTKTSICNDSGDISGILGMRKRVKSILKNDASLQGKCTSPGTPTHSPLWFDCCQFTVWRPETTDMPLPGRLRKIVLCVCQAVRMCIQFRRLLGTMHCVPGPMLRPKIQRRDNRTSKSLSIERCRHKGR